MNNSNLNNSGILPNFLNNSSSDSKYLFGDNTSTEFNQFSVLKNSYYVYFENNIPSQQENKQEIEHDRNVNTSPM
jgi:hypothetical protein